MATAQAGSPVQRSTDERDPHYHSARIQGMLQGVVDHVRQDAGKVQDPKARALFETTAEVLIGLGKAYRDFDAGTEVWR